MLFKAMGYYVDDPNVLIEVNKNKIRLYNEFYNIDTDFLSVEKDDLGHFASVGRDKYYIHNFVSFNNLQILQKELK